MADLKYNAHKVPLLTKLIDMEAANMKILLVTTAYSPAVGDTMATVNSNEISAGGNYSTGGQVLDTPVVSLVGNVAQLDAGDAIWAASTITAGGAVVYYDDTSDYPICYFDFGGDKVSSNGEFKVTWDANGIMDVG